MLDGDVDGSAGLTEVLDAAKGHLDARMLEGASIDGARSVQTSQRISEDTGLVRDAQPAAVNLIDPRTSPDGKFSVVIADPAWSFTNKASRAVAENHYKTMSINEICRLDVENWVTENAALFLWVTDAHLLDGSASRVLDAWSFIGKQVIPWLKFKDGRPQIGLGNYFRHVSELCIFATRGKMKVSRHDIPAYVIAPRTEHSRKPDMIHQIAEASLPGPRLEMFARGPVRAGWYGWGNEAGVAK